MSDAESGPLRLSFNPQLRVAFRGATITSDAGLLLPREPDERLGQSALIERHLGDPRTGRNCQFPRRPTCFISRFIAAWLGRPEIYEALERRGVRYAIRLPANDVLERQIEDLLTRPRGRPSYAPLVRYRSFHYQAASCKRPRRVIAKVEHHLGELFARVGFIITTLTGTNRAVVRFYNQRGTAEQRIKEGKRATHWTRLSCHRFRPNEVRLLLGVIAYNLGNLLRRLVLPAAIQDWSLTSLQQRLFKTGGRLISHAWYFTLQLAESYLTGALSWQILTRIERLAWDPT